MFLVRIIPSFYHIVRIHANEVERNRRLWKAFQPRWYLKRFSIPLSWNPMLAFSTNTPKSEKIIIIDQQLNLVRHKIQEHNKAGRPTQYIAPPPPSPPPPPVPLCWTNVSWQEILLLYNYLIWKYHGAKHFGCITKIELSRKINLSLINPKYIFPVHLQV